MSELRAVSTRAKITRTRFVNEYNFGDLRADPRKLMARYFDAQRQYPNWGLLLVSYAPQLELAVVRRPRST